MENNTVILCNNDSFSIEEIVFAKIVRASYDDLKMFEEQINGNRHIEQTHAEIPALDNELIEEIVHFLNKYSCEISYFWPSPPKKLALGSKSAFSILSASQRICEDYFRRHSADKQTDDYDLSINWEYRYFTEDDIYGHANGVKEKKISLRQDIYPALKALAYAPSKSKAQQKKDNRNSLINLGVSLIGLPSLAVLDEGFMEISGEGKDCAKRLYQQLERYFYLIKTKELAELAQQTRDLQYRDFMDANRDKEMLFIKTTRNISLDASDDSLAFYQYLDGYCNFDILEKKREIDSAIQQRNASAQQDYDIILCGNDVIPVSSILSVKIIDFPLFTAREKYYEIFPEKLNAKKSGFIEFLNANKERKMLFIKTNIKTKSKYTRADLPACYEYIDGLCGFDIFEKKQEIEVKIEKKKQQSASKKSELRNQIIGAFDSENLLHHRALSTVNKYKEFSAIRVFCCKYIPQLSERDFDIDSLSKDYPFYISQDNLATFKENWIRMCRSLSALKRGIKGEEKVYEVLQLFDDRCRIIRSYTWDCEHDFIVITPYGVSTIEVKTLSGDYLLTETGILKCLSNDHIDSKDVALQSKKHVETLRKHLKNCVAFNESIPLQEIICSAEANFTIKDDYHYIPVCYYNTLDKILFAIREEVLSATAMEEIQNYLLANQQEAFQFDICEIDSREAFIEAFADVASGFILATNHNH